MLSNSSKVKIREEYLKKSSCLVKLHRSTVRTPSYEYFKDFDYRCWTAILQNTFHWLTLDVTKILLILMKVISMASMKSCLYLSLFAINVIVLRCTRCPLYLMLSNFQSIHNEKKLIKQQLPKCCNATIYLKLQLSVGMIIVHRYCDWLEKKLCTMR